ncbi:MAG: hypothetical protein HZB13_21955 [Acidobacteria bacterium]|nr:hypothetical protein [Acidobacteriota bacterium]
MKTVIRVALRPGGMTRLDEPGAWEIPSFATFPSRSRSFPFAIAASICFHLLAVIVIPEAIRIATTPPINVMRDLLAKSRVEPLLLRIPASQPLLLPAVRRAVARAAPVRRSAPAPSPVIPPAQTAPQEISTAAAVLVQPQSVPPPAAVALRIRSYAVWTGRSPRRTPIPIVAGSAEPLPATVIAGPVAHAEIPLPAPPVEAVSSQPVHSDRAGLTLPPSGSAPLRSEAPPEPLGSAAAGEPAAVIAISSLPPAPDQVLEIPPGNYLITGGNGGSPKPETTSPAPSPEPAKAGPVKTAQLAAPSPPTPSPATTSPPATSPSTPSAPTPSSPAPRPAPAEALVSSTRAIHSPPPVAALSPVPVAQPVEVQVNSNRVIATPSGTIQLRGNNDGSTSLTYPRDGRFDIVVVQSGAPEAAGDLSQILSGKPVHTVFIQVGETREWVLQYCLPAGSTNDIRQSGMVVTLGAPPPLKAPYLLEAHLPPGPAWRAKNHQVFHALLSANGRLEQIRTVKPGSEASQLLDYLPRWTFRPATAGAETKSVEVLLIIPPDPTS